jgi:hypothetical protein
VQPIVQPPQQPANRRGADGVARFAQPPTQLRQAAAYPLLFTHRIAGDFRFDEFFQDLDQGRIFFSRTANLT